MAGNRPQYVGVYRRPVYRLLMLRFVRYLFRALQSLLRAPGLHRHNVLVVLDGIHREPADVCRLLNVSCAWVCYC